MLRAREALSVQRQSLHNMCACARHKGGQVRRGDSSDRPESDKIVKLRCPILENEQIF